MRDEMKIKYQKRIENEKEKYCNGIEKSNDREHSLDGIFQ